MANSDCWPFFCRLDPANTVAAISFSLPGQNVAKCASLHTRLERDMDEKQILERFNTHAPGFIRMLGGRFVAFEPATGTCTAEFDISHDFCHSGNVVQGGFVTAILDATMSHAAFATGEDVVNISSLEIKTTYLEPTLAGRLRVEGRVIKSGYKIAFMEGRVYDSNGVLTATGNTVAKISRRK